jgi:catechol 2,3-dioxygenase-like lactoylglutathione lyase family enzyme
MECKIELIFVPVSDVDRAIEFYVDKVGFTLDMQARVDENTRFVQVTPPTSACSIAFGEGITDMTPGTQNSIQVVVPDVEAARQELLRRGVDAPEVAKLAWGSFTSVHRSRRQHLDLAGASAARVVRRRSSRPDRATPLTVSLITGTLL